MKFSVRPLTVAFSICALAACSGGSPVPVTSGAGTQSVDVVHPSAVTEVFKAGKIAVKKRTCVGHSSGTATFSAKGHASGRYSGSFKLSGQWSFTKLGSVSIFTFAESFEITGAHRINGTITTKGSPHLKATCKTFGPVTNPKDLVYHLGTATGPATMNQLKNGSSLKQQMH
jgi:hypothetical protein